MKTEYKYVAFNQEFTHNGIKYIKANHNRGKVIGQKNVYKNFAKSDVVDAVIEDTLLNSYMKVS
jgi:hypothetical protein